MRIKFKLFANNDYEIIAADQDDTYINVSTNNEGETIVHVKSPDPRFLPGYEYVKFGHKPEEDI